MARFWKRGEDESVERLLRANRETPSDEFTSSILDRIAGSTFRTRSVRSPRRIGLALALTVVALALAGVLGGVGAASAGMGGIFHVATKAVTPSHTTTTTSSSSKKTDDDKKGDKGSKGSKGDDPDGDADDQGGKGGKGDDEGDHDDHHGHDGDHHQYKVGVCHWADHKYVLIYVSPQGAANHLKHHPKDKLPVNGRC